MVERIDHTAEARKHLEYVGSFMQDDSQDWPLVNATVAQAEATLALVERQEASALIAFAETMTRGVARDGVLARAAGLLGVQS